jgi:hypothetical protein
LTVLTGGEHRDFRAPQGARALLRRAQNIRRQLGGAPSIMSLFPDKPKAMHWSTYERLFERAERAELIHLPASQKWLDRLKLRI